MKFIAKFIFCHVLIFLYSGNIFSKNIFTLDKALSEISFELPVLLAENVEGKFTNIDGFVILDSENINNNKALFSVELKSLEFNYEKYRNLLYSNIFFDVKNFPISLVGTKKFTIPLDSNYIELNTELQIKDIVQTIPIGIEINYLANDLIQVKTSFKFSRTDYELGKGSWLSTLLLLDKIYLKANLFLNRDQHSSLN